MDAKLCGIEPGAGDDLQRRGAAPGSASRTERHILLGERWNGNMVKLYESNILLLTHEARKRRINPRRWKYLIIPQGLTNPRPLDVRTVSEMRRTP